MLPPERLRADHDVADFANGKYPALDFWLKERALACEGLSARTYVICRAGQPLRVVGYYAISTAMEERQALPTAKLRRGMPQRVPLLLIGRLAVDQSMQGRGFGTDLLADALRRCCAVAEIAGVRAIVAHAIDDEAVAFYAHHGFVHSPLGERVMLLSINAAQAFFAG
ncbi:MAG: GNAT family N-acetyltransferase [Alphaproteobacteria bacterium]|nr:GNAT family N-acetyltransferase [Alphaproteobacteria bacterium]MDE2493679.1 GNAT family N-acetyltransferase [Alphaproteobacteria bacterium]